MTAHTINKFDIIIYVARSLPPSNLHPLDIFITVEIEQYFRLINVPFSIKRHIVFAVYVFVN